MHIEKLFKLSDFYIISPTSVEWQNKIPLIGTSYRDREERPNTESYGKVSFKNKSFISKM